MKSRSRIRRGRLEKDCWQRLKENLSWVGREASQVAMTQGRVGCPVKPGLWLQPHQLEWKEEWKRGGDHSQAQGSWRSGQRQHSEDLWLTGLGAAQPGSHPKWDLRHQGQDPHPTRQHSRSCRQAAGQTCGFWMWNGKCQPEEWVLCGESRLGFNNLWYNPLTFGPNWTMSYCTFLCDVDDNQSSALFYEGWMVSPVDDFN